MFNESLSSIKSIIGGLAGNAKKPEESEPGPGDAKPSLNTKPDDGSGQLPPLTEEQVKAWFEEIRRAEDRLKQQETQWDMLLDEYLPVVEKSGTPEMPKVNGHFRNVHTKLGQLFPSSPDLILSPCEPGPADNSMPNPMQQFVPPGTMDPATGQPLVLPPISLEEIVSIKQQILKKTLGRDGIKGNRLMQELLFDVEAWSGIAACKIGYKCVFKAIQKPKMIQPPPPPGAVLNLNDAPLVPATDAMGQPIMETQQIPIFEEWYGKRFSPKKLLFDADLNSTRYDEDAKWWGMIFYMSPKWAQKPIEEGGLGLTEEETGKGAEDDRRHSYSSDTVGKKKPTLLKCYEIFAKASYYTDELHPQAINHLVLVDGVQKRAPIWRTSPDQEFDENHRLTRDSLIGSPIRILTVRDMADSPFPKSDAAFTNNGIKQESTYLRQSVKLRDSAIGKYLYDQGAFDEDEVKVIRDGEAGAFIGVKDGQLSQGAEKVFTTTAQVKGSRDSYEGWDRLKRNNDEMIGISPTQAGVQTDTVRTATEIDKFSSAARGRNENEKDRVIDWWLDLARGIDQLLMRYATEQQWIELVGEEGSRKMQIWNNKIISLKCLYEMAPDSMMHTDNEQDFNQNLKLYNITAPDPLANRPYLLRRMFRSRGLDPAKAVLAGAVPPGGPMPPHGGAATQGQQVSQHESAKSGGKPNAPGAENAREEQVK